MSRDPLKLFVDIQTGVNYFGQQLSEIMRIGTVFNPRRSNKIWSAQRFNQGDKHETVQRVSVEENCGNLFALFFVYSSVEQWDSAFCWPLGVYDFRGIQGVMNSRPAYKIKRREAEEKQR